MVPVVFVCGRNAERWIKPCLTSVCMSIRKNGFGRVVFMDDSSDDATVKMGKTILGGSGVEHSVIVSKARSGRVALYQEALRACDGLDVVIGIDADDWLVDFNAVTMILKKYAGGAWSTWGRDTSHWVDPATFTLLRSSSFPEHPWSSYACLMKAVKLDDLMFEGRYSDVATDRFLFYPPFEMSAERLMCVEGVIYEYNYPTPSSVSRTDPWRQKKAVDMLLRKRPYARLDKLP